MVMMEKRRRSNGKGVEADRQIQKVLCDPDGVR